MLWQVTIASTGPQPEVDRERENLNRERKATGREKVFFTLLDWTSTNQGQPINWFPNRSTGSLTGQLVPQLVELVGQSLDQFDLLALKAYLFHFFSFLTLRQGL